MKMKKLASIINPMSEEKLHQAPSLDEEGIGDKISGFAKYTSPKKGNRGTSDDINGFAQITKKNKHNWSANDGNKDICAQSMIEAKQEIGVSVDGDKSGFAKNNCLLKNKKKRSKPASASTEKADITKMRRFRSPTENIPAKSAEHAPTNPASAAAEDGYASISQKSNEGLDFTMKTTEKAGFTDIAKMRRFRSPTENIPAKSAERAPTKSGHHNSTPSVDRVPTKPVKPTSAGDKDGYAPISQKSNEGLDFTVKTTEKAGFTDMAKMKRFRSPTESIPGKSVAHITTKPGQHNSTQFAEHVPTIPASAGDEEGYAPVSQAKMRRFESPTESIRAKSAERVPIKPGQHNSIQSVERVPTKPGHQNSTQSGWRIPAQPEHQNANRQLTPQSQSCQGTSHSGQTTPNQSRESRQLTPRSQSPQGTPNLSSSAANNYIYWNIGSTDSDGRTRVEVIKKVLEPSHDCSAKIRQIMYEKLEPTGYNWKSISKETRDFYFEEFKKYFVWRQSDAVIYQGWLANARRKYSEVCSIARSAWEKHEQPDKRISMDVYLSWSKFWETPTFQKKSETQKNNRSSGVDGCLSTHTSGSASHRTIAARAQMKYQCDPTADQIFLITHLKNPNVKKIMCGEDEEDEENGENCNDERIWVDKKSQLTYEKFERLYEEQVKAGLPVDKNALFLEAAGGFDKKKRVYGVGSSQDLFYRPEAVPCNLSFANMENHKLREELKVVKDKMNTMENQIAEILKISFRQAQSPTTDVDDVGQNGDYGDE